MKEKQMQPAICSTADFIVEKMMSQGYYISERIAFAGLQELMHFYFTCPKGRKLSAIGIHCFYRSCLRNQIMSVFDGTETLNSIFKEVRSVLDFNLKGAIDQFLFLNAIKESQNVEQVFELFKNCVKSEKQKENVKFTVHSYMYFLVSYPLEFLPKLCALLPEDSLLNGIENDEFISGFIQLCKGQWKKASELLELAVKRNPREDQVWDMYCMSKLEGGLLINEEVEDMMLSRLTDFGSQLLVPFLTTSNDDQVEHVASAIIKKAESNEKFKILAVRLASSDQRFANYFERLSAPSIEPIFAVNNVGDFDLVRKMIRKKRSYNEITELVYFNFEIFKNNEEIGHLMGLLDLILSHQRGDLLVQIYNQFLMAHKEKNFHFASGYINEWKILIDIVQGFDMIDGNWNSKIYRISADLKKSMKKKLEFEIRAWREFMGYQMKGYMSLMSLHLLEEIMPGNFQETLLRLNAFATFENFVSFHPLLHELFAAWYPNEIDFNEQKVLVESYQYDYNFLKFHTTKFEVVIPFLENLLLSFQSDEAVAIPEYFHFIVDWTGAQTNRTHRIPVLEKICEHLIFISRYIQIPFEKMRPIFQYSFLFFRQRFSIAVIYLQSTNETLSDQFASHLLSGISYHSPFYYSERLFIASALFERGFLDASNVKLLSHFFEMTVMKKQEYSSLLSKEFFDFIKCHIPSTNKVLSTGVQNFQEHFAVTKKTKKKSKKPAQEILVQPIIKVEENEQPQILVLFHNNIVKEFPLEDLMKIKFAMINPLFRWKKILETNLARFPLFIDNLSYRVVFERKVAENGASFLVWNVQKKSTLGNHYAAMVNRVYDGDESKFIEL